MGPTTDGSVTLHSSWRGMVLNALGALIVLAAGIWGLFAGGINVISGTIFVFGVSLVGVVVFDYPIAATFSADGVVRRMLLRHQKMDWSGMDQLSRTRPKMLSSFRKLAHGGLVATIGRRRYLLVDHCESRDEYNEIERLLGDKADEIGLWEVPRPAKGTNPTWLYRRAKWEPDTQEPR